MDITGSYYVCYIMGGLLGDMVSPPLYTVYRVGCVSHMYW